MSRVNNLIGRVFGKLTVVERSPENNKYSRAIWVCECKCGKVVKTLGKCLIDGSTRSCGCLHKEVSTNKAFGKPGYAPIKNRYQRRAVERGLEFKLTDEEFANLLKGNCHYCGVSPQRLLRSGKKQRLVERFSYNGIDRIDSAGGYVNGNVVTACFPCNKAKGNFSYKEFLDIVRSIANHKKLCTDEPIEIPSPAESNIEIIEAY